MLGTLLTIIGIAIIFVSLILIRTQNESEIKMYNEIVYKHKEIKEYTHTMENIIDNLDYMIDDFFSKVDSFEKKLIHKDKDTSYNRYNKEDSNLEDKELSSSYELKTKDNNDMKSKILHYDSIGMKPSEIAKEMGKGVREVEILLKMYKNARN